MDIKWTLKQKQGHYLFFFKGYIHTYISVCWDYLWKNIHETIKTGFRWGGGLADYSQRWERDLNVSLYSFSYSLLFKNHIQVLAKWLSWLECSVSFCAPHGCQFIPGQGTCLGCGFSPQLEHIQEATNWCFSLTSMFLSIFLSISPSLYRNQWTCPHVKNK